jgi:Ni2+-binding GTPase involved in maturation of urease and hydrogenase
MDLAEATESDCEAAVRNIFAVRPGMTILQVSSKSGAGMGRYLSFIEIRLGSLRPKRKYILCVAATKEIRQEQIR